MVMAFFMNAAFPADCYRL